MVLKGLISKLSYPCSHVHMQLHAQQLATNLPVCTMLSFLHSISQYTHGSYITIKLPVVCMSSTLLTILIIILSNYTCQQPRHTRKQHAHTQHMSFTLQLSCTVYPCVIVCSYTVYIQACPTTLLESFLIEILFVAICSYFVHPMTFAL